MNKARKHTIQNHEDWKRTLLPCELDSSRSEMPILSVVQPPPIELRDVATQLLCFRLRREAAFNAYRLSFPMLGNVHPQLVSCFARASPFSLFLWNSPSFVHFCTSSHQPALLWFSFPLFCIDSEHFWRLKMLVYFLKNYMTFHNDNFRC